ncbi:hypothetical protein Pfo_020579 [Paulownia fortunei]|nr:hypothetical protein Pfo_020579 [Paulownia fortunei]
MCRVFLWGSRKAPVAWKEISLPKNEGGLGFRDLNCWNLALWTKLLWNIHAKKDTLWVRWINSFYLNDVSIWDWNVRKRDSSLFKKIADIRNLLIEAKGTRQQAAQLLSEWFDGSNFVTARAYEFFRVKEMTKLWAKDIWRPYITPKHSFILWLCAKGWLLTKDCIKHIEIDGTCNLCDTKLENTRHLFFNCSISTTIWKHIRDWVGIKREMSNINSALKWIKKEASGTLWQNKAKKIALACTVYHIWTVRNGKIFEGIPPIIPSIVHKIKTYVYKSLFTLYPHVLARYEFADSVGNGA